MSAAEEKWWKLMRPRRQRYFSRGSLIMAVKRFVYSVTTAEMINFSITFPSFILSFKNYTTGDLHPDYNNLDCTENDRTCFANGLSHNVWVPLSPALQMEEGSRNVRLGALIALMVEEGQDWKQVEIPPPDAAAPPATHAAAAPVVPPAAPSPPSPPKQATSGPWVLPFIIWTVPPRVCLLLINWLQIRANRGLCTRWW